MITPINNISLKNPYSNLKATPVNFTAHKDFKRIAQDYNIKASCYFRRGTFYGAPASEFADIISALRKVFSTEGKKDFLIIGVADSQETFSLMAAAKDILENKILKDCVTLKCIDLQSKPTDKKLYKDSFYDSCARPPYAFSSFVYDKENFGNARTQHYRVTDEIFDLVRDSYLYNSLWNTRAQDAVKKLPDEGFDVISINNVLPYIRMDGNKAALDTVKSLIRATKKGGVIITDVVPCVGECNLNFFCQKIEEGIWQRKNKVGISPTLL